MPDILYLKKRIGHSYLVWFQNSNMYFQLQEPAWFVFSKIVRRHKSSTIAVEFAQRYSTTPQESITFVDEIRSQVMKMNLPASHTIKEEQFSDIPDNYTYTPYSVHHYRLGERVITFSYETKLLELYLHPLISHLETSANNIETLLFELFIHDNRIVFRYDSVVKGVWTNDETHLVKGMIFMFLINVLHNKTDDDWLMTVHASALTNGRKTILFSAAPGNGKTTIAALLQNQGFRLISDDFVPIDRENFCAYPFPIAMSVKEGAMDLLASIYPTLEQKSLNYITPEKSVRYLAPNDYPGSTKEIYPVTEFIFIHYDKTADFIWEKLDPLTAMKYLLEEAWVAPVEGNAKLLFDRISQISFYELTYSNNQKAIDAITHLFDA